MLKKDLKNQITLKVTKKKLTKLLQSVKKTLKLNLNVIFEDFCPLQRDASSKILLKILPNP